MPRLPEKARRMPAPDTSRIEVGRCVTCGEQQSWGYFIADLTTSTALVQHCTDDEDEDVPPPRRDPPQLTAAAAVSVAAVVVVCVLLLTIWR
ncbi:hypothetical protein OG401_20950 [Kitasatospora purpeofusca]|uniref:hypothetical protein n=1 Tax=Kitasatospora purpeofusca TaxID=67352 RepID=UPI00225ACC69|nr:hypothetical protein [Kitasatospora purpeofusca]MCX4686749.1 hypothetical protein [Kitasatospora purpeofusca]